MKIAFIGLGLLAFVSLILLLKAITLPYYPDFASYYYAMVNVMHQSNPYITTKQMILPFLYPPPSLFFFLPFASLPYSIAERVYVIFSFLCFAASIIIFFKLFKVKLFSLVGFLLIILAANYFPEKFTLGMGQFNNVILLLLVLFLYLFDKGKAYAGIFLGLALSFKLFPMLLPFYLIFEKRWKMLGVTILTIIIVWLGSYVFFGYDTFVYFFRIVMPTLLSSHSDVYYNQSLIGFLARTIPDAHVVKTIGSAVSIGLLLLSFIIILKKKPQKLLALSHLITIQIILQAIAWQHHYVWMLIPFMVTLFYMRKKQLDRKYYVVLGMSFLLTAVNFKDPLPYPLLLHSHALYGAILLYILQLCLFLKKSKQSKKDTK